MPPKQNKEHQKKMQKKVEDMTFGLKNKKGAKMQKYIKQLENQVILLIFIQFFRLKAILKINKRRRRMKKMILRT